MACAVLLCLTVLCWGTGYKMSLYFSADSAPAQFNCSQPTQMNPPAKLLTEKERPARPSSLDHDQATPKSAVMPLLWAVVFLASATQVRIHLQSSRTRACLGRHLYGIENSILSSFGFRPPPSFSVLS